MVDQVASHYIRDWEAAHFVDVVSYLYYRVPRVAVLPCLFSDSVCICVSVCVDCPEKSFPFSVLSVLSSSDERGSHASRSRVHPGTVAYSRYVHKYISYDPLPKLHKT